MIKVGITGQSGFIGTHLYNFFNLKKDEITVIPFKDAFFSNTEELANFVKKCDTVIHLAALNRHNEPDEIYKTNMELVQKLIHALEHTCSTPHVIFSSSTQEERDNAYGKSKREGRQLLAEWASRNNALYTGLVIPNVFGPFGNPHYNSAVATFCHQLTHNETPKIEIDGLLKLVYVGELTEHFYSIISNKLHSEEHKIAPASEKKVSELLELLRKFKSSYFDKGIFPQLNNNLEINLFNTFRSYMDVQNFYPVSLSKNSDARGAFVETVKTNLGGQFSFSTTKPGITRGNHFHTRKIERFAVIKGKATIQLRRIGTDKVLNFELDGEKPSYVDMPVWYTHNITNTGDDELYTLFWINEFFDPEDTDTFFEAVEQQ